MDDENVNLYPEYIPGQSPILFSSEEEEGEQPNQSIATTYYSTPVPTMQAAIREDQYVDVAGGGAGGGAGAGAVAVGVDIDSHPSNSQNIQSIQIQIPIEVARQQQIEELRTEIFQQLHVIMAAVNRIFEILRELFV